MLRDAGARARPRRAPPPVEMFQVLAPSPPVPAVSTRSSRFGRDGNDVRAHRLGAPGDLVGGLALQPQRDQEAADLGRAWPRPAMIVSITAAASSRGEVVAVEQLRERLLDHAGLQEVASRALRRAGVSTDSGWNWTPSTRSSRWRTAITSPSAVLAETSRQSGTEVAASEW